MSVSTIIYTTTDEAPVLATRSFLPVMRSFTGAAGVQIETRDISLAGRILAGFPDYLDPQQQQSDALAELGVLVKQADANIIKLPNISASVPQLKAAIAELQSLGFALPDYPGEVENDEQRRIKDRYAGVLGSAVNPVLREGNSDRRVAPAVKAYARKHPHEMGPWAATAKARVASMRDGDFYSSEQSVVIAGDDEVKITLHTTTGEQIVLKQSTAVLAAEIIDASVMRVQALRDFYASEIKAAQTQGLLLSLHLKATMMKISDPIMFGHAVSVFYQPVFEKYADTFHQLGIDPRNGLGDVYAKITALPDAERKRIEADITALYATRPQLAMVNVEKGLTNLHAPNSVIVDASMPAAIRFSGKMWGPDGNMQETVAMIPDRCYAGIYQETIAFCKQHGALDVSTMGTASNVGLMAQKAEEYGSHDKTFEIPAAGKVCVTDSSGSVLMEHTVEQGDIWRMCQCKDAPIRDWVKLAVRRARLTGQPAIFWLDPKRPHDMNVQHKVLACLKEQDTRELEIQILSPAAATRYTLERMRVGKDTISVTGNVLRDYLTDLFPILELGSSAKMLSIVPLLAGGGLFETGAGGTAPLLVSQLVEENHLSWDSLGEFLALAVSLEELAQKTGSKKVQVLAAALNQANTEYLDNNKSPSVNTGEIDTRGSHFYLSLYWALALAEQNDDAELKAVFTPLARQLAGQEDTIISELLAVQGRAVDLGGYYRLNAEKTNRVMRPSATWNAIIDSL